MLPSMAIVTPAQRAMSIPSRGDSERQMATAAAPNDCPSSLDAARMPPALPLRLAGALLIMAFMFGD